ncbi:MAG: dephospho-CoA kinase [Phycisphaerales bacterium]|nr:dephospho-CoA kinase [Phycisphaerales bacterium]
MNRLAPPGERVILRIRPHPVYILLTSLGWLVAVALLAAAAVWAGRSFGITYTGRIVTALAALAIVKLIWQTLQWGSRDYVLTENRAAGMLGVIRRYRSDLPLARLQHLTMYRSLGERLTGVGTIGFATAGTAFVEMYWVMVNRPSDVLAAARDAMDRAQGRAARPLPLIGLAGGIGAGKSEAARILGELGCAVVDSDAEARAVMQRPGVRDELVRWWGSEILDADGLPDRRRVADIVFRDSAQRRRLEALVHPLVRIVRDERRAAAAVAGARAVIIDAPLLFEAGVDRECDAVLFIDSPRELRLARITARGWDEAELNRREAVQLTLDEKRRRSTHVVRNSGSPAQLRDDLAAALESVLRTMPVAASPAGC